MRNRSGLLIVGSVFGASALFCAAAPERSVAETGRGQNEENRR
jgi:hypothetical protein